MLVLLMEVTDCMKYTVEIASDGMIYTPNLMKIIQVTLWLLRQ
jgi:hypothetical protein